MRCFVSLNELDFHPGPLAVLAFLGTQNYIPPVHFEPDRLYLSPLSRVIPPPKLA